MAYHPHKNNPLTFPALCMDSLLYDIDDYIELKS